MFRSRNLEPNKIHLRALQLAHENPRDITYEELLMKDNSVCAHQKNLQILATEMFKSKNRISPELLDDIFIYWKNHTTFGIFLYLKENVTIRYIIRVCPH